MVGYRILDYKLVLEWPVWLKNCHNILQPQWFILYKVSIKKQKN
jgi:hypothetical protein